MEPNSYPPSNPHRAHWGSRAGSLLVLTALAACRSPVMLAPEPHESVLSIIGELKTHLALGDPYRDEPGMDPEGQNIYRLTLTRLAQLEGLVGDEYADIIAFARAESLERLGEYEAASEAFEAAAGAGTSLSTLAGARAQWARRLAELTATPEGILRLEDYRLHFDTARAELIELLRGDPPAPYGALARVEMERLLERKTLMFSASRLGAGAARLAEESARLLVEDNAESARLGRHLILLGGTFETRARDYATLAPPSGAQFRLSEWAAWVGQAREAYAAAARRDGDPAKPEAQARLRALDAWAQSVRRLAG